MKQNNLGWFIFVLCIVGWALFEVYPPTSQNLVQEFAARGVNQDATFHTIVDQATALEKANTNSQFTALQEAIGTNDIQKYFPKIAATNEVRPNLFILNRLQRYASGKIKLGLDLQGGTSYLVEMDTTVLTNMAGTNSVSQSDVSGALSQAIEVLRKRIDRFGVAEPVIEAAGANQILIQMPGLSPSDKATAETNITKSAYLEFRMVHDDSQQIIDESSGLLRPGQAVPPGYTILRHNVKGKDGRNAIEAIVVKKKAEAGLAGDIIDNARLGYDPIGKPEVDFRLTSDAGKAFADLTAANVGHRMAVVLDGELYTAPVIRSAIETGDVSISGNYSREEALTLQNVLENPLRAPLRIVSSRDVGPTLGKDNINSGIHASLYAVIGVSVFMLCYYLIAGLAANIALLTNVIILLGVMCAAGTTFTLPGIAGGVLTVGMAVDANVLIYERIREELAKGKSLRGAIDAGYARAFGTIFDSHVTTLISSIILILTGTGEIKGFGVTLTIGVAASLFTALVVTRLIFNFLVNFNLIQGLTMLHVITATKVNFVQVAKPLAYLTWTFAIVAMIYGGVARGGKLFGVDFVGGDSTTYSLTQPVSQEDVSHALADVGQKDAQVQYQKDSTSGKQVLSVTSATGTASKVTTALQTKFPSAEFQVVNSYSVGASVSQDIVFSAVVAMFCAMMGILLYVALRYEFSFAVAAVAAVLHDVLLTLGVFCIANQVSGRQFSATVVAAILTIIGFSINDKIVIFDRIREDLKLGMRGSFKEIINHALNQTLSRTIITSGTVFIATLVLFIWGGGAINDFAFTFLVGIITGTYSSIYIASVIVLWWHKGERPNIGASQVALQNSTSAKV